MKKLMFSISRITIMIAVISFSLNNKVQCQNFEMANEDEAIVYFVKCTITASAITFNYYDSEQYIGRFKGQGYFIYRCEPGEHVFWASKEFTNFITADLKPGGTYLVAVKASTGLLVANPILSPISGDDVKNINKALKVLKKKDAKVFSEKELTDWNESYKDDMAKNMVHFEEKVNEGAEFKHLSSDMALPSEYIMSKK